VAQAVLDDAQMRPVVLQRRERQPGPGEEAPGNTTVYTWFVREGDGRAAATRLAYIADRARRVSADRGLQYFV
jgi:hypothetical protein